MLNINNKLSQFLLVTFAVFCLFAGSAIGQKGAIKTDSRITYHLGPVMPGTSAIYYIWYGCWNTGCYETGPARDILIDYGITIGGSPYMRINTTYSNSSGLSPNGNIIWGGEVFDPYSHGAVLSRADVEDIIVDFIGNGNGGNGTLPADPNAVFFVMASPDVSMGASCSEYCENHRSFNDPQIPGLNLKYVFVGNSARCPSVCAQHFLNPDGTRKPTPNNNFGADGMVNWMSHGLSGILTNPQGNAWFDRYGLENSDKCQGKFGPTYLTPNGAIANMRIIGGVAGARDYMMQQNWVNDGRGRCAISFP